MNNERSAEELYQLAKSYFDAYRNAGKEARENEKQADLDKAKYYGDLAQEMEDAANFEIIGTGKDMEHKASELVRHVDMMIGAREADAADAAEKLKAGKLTEEKPEPKPDIMGGDTGEIPIITDMNLAKDYEKLGDNENALKHYKKAAEAGSGEACARIAKLYGTWEPDETIKWLEKAVSLGYDAAEDELRIMKNNSWLIKGIVKRQEKDAAEKAEQAKRAEAKPLDSFALAEDYYNRGDYAKAFEHYKKAAEAGDPNAKTELAGMYYAGDGVTQNTDVAIRLLKEAEKQGNARATEYLKELYEEEGIAEEIEAEENLERGLAYLEEKDYHNAVKYMIKAAEAGNVKAMAKLGLFLDKHGFEHARYLHGIYGANAAYVIHFETEKWLKKAADGGDQDAISYYKELARFQETERRRAAAQQQPPQLSAEHKRFQAEMAKSKERYDKEQRERAAKEKRDNESAEATRRSEQAHQARVRRNTYGDNH